MRRRIRELTLEQFLTLFPRIAGAEDPPDPAPDPADPAPDPPPDPADPPTPDPADPAPDPADPAKPDPPPETVTMPKSEADALRRKVAEAERQRRQAEREAREREEQRLQQQGEYQQLAEQRETENQRLREQLAKSERDQRVSEIAAELNFHDPHDVLHRLTADEADDETLARGALERIAGQSPHLVRQPDAPKPAIGQVLEPSAESPKPGEPAGTRPRSKEDYDRMSADELSKLPEDEYRRALSLMKS